MLRTMLLVILVLRVGDLFADMLLELEMLKRMEETKKSCNGRL